MEVGDVAAEDVVGGAVGVVRLRETDLKGSSMNRRGLSGSRRNDS